MNEHSPIPLLLTLLLLTGCVATDPSSDGRPSLTVLAYNIHHGEGVDKRLDLRRIAALIVETGADVVALQEIDDGCRRTDGLDQARRLAELTGMHHAFGPFFDYQGGRYGMALLSRLPMEDVRNIRLPDGAEPRAALAATVQTADGHRATVCGVHLYRTPAERMAQAVALMESLTGEPEAVVLAGDFNSVPGGPVMRALEESYEVIGKDGPAATFPSVLPVREIDFILIERGAPLTADWCRVLDEKVASDHRPVLARLRWVPAR